MIAAHKTYLAKALALALALSTGVVQAQDFSPYYDTIGKGAYDLYRDTVLCTAVLERTIAADPATDNRPQIEKGVNYTRNFARFLLETGNVVDQSGTILTTKNLPADQYNARVDWQTVLFSLADKGETPDGEIARCLALYGHDWE